MNTSLGIHSRAVSMTAVCILGVMTVACGERSATEAARVATVEVSPAASTVPVGSVMTLTAEPRDESGNLVRGQQVYWSSSAPTVAAVSSAGVVSALGSGEAQIAATAQGVSAVATIRVSDAPPVTQSVVTRVVVSPPSGVVRASGSATFRQLQLSAVAYDQDNRVMSGRTFVWSVNKAQVASVDANGLVVGVKEGEAVVTATTGGVSGRTDILVIK